MPTIIVLGTARNDGDTKKIAIELKSVLQCDLVELCDYDFSYYDYTHRNRNDDFIPLIRNIIENYDTIVLATPVYWYAMSGRMKVFFDRITDLLEIEKELGRRLRNKSMAVITSSIGDNLGNEFWLPFTKTAEYLGMEFIAGLHTNPSQYNDNDIKEFGQLIQSKRS